MYLQCAYLHMYTYIKYIDKKSDIRKNYYEFFGHKIFKIVNLLNLIITY